MATQLTTSHDANGGYTLYPSNSNGAAYLWDGSLVFLVADGASISLFRVASPGAGTPSATSVKTFAVPGATASSIHNGDIYLVDNGNSTNDVWIGYAENNNAGGAYVQHAVYDASGVWTWDTATSCVGNGSGTVNQMSVVWTGTYLISALRAFIGGVDVFAINYTTTKAGTSGWLANLVTLGSLTGNNTHYFGSLQHDTTLAATVAVYTMHGDLLTSRVLPDTSSPALANWGAETSLGAGSTLTFGDFQGAAALLDHTTGRMHVAYYDGSGTGKSIGYVTGTVTVSGTSSAVSWGTPLSVGTQSVNNDSPDLAVDSNGRVYILWANHSTGNAAADVFYAHIDSPYTSASAETNLTNSGVVGYNHPMTPRRARLTAGYVPILYTSGTASPYGIQYDNTSLTFSTGTPLTAQAATGIGVAPNAVLGVAVALQASSGLGVGFAPNATLATSVALVASSALGIGIAPNGALSAAVALTSAAAFGIGIAPNAVVGTGQALSAQPGTGVGIATNAALAVAVALLASAGAGIGIGPNATLGTGQTTVIALVTLSNSGPSVALGDTAVTAALGDS